MALGKATPENMGRVRAFLAAWCLRHKVATADLVLVTRAEAVVEVRWHFYADALEAGHPAPAIAAVMGFDASGVRKGAKVWREKRGGAA